MQNYLVPRCESRSGVSREQWNVAGRQWRHKVSSVSQRGLRKIDRSRVSGEAAQTPPKKIFWR